MLRGGIKKMETVGFIEVVVAITTCNILQEVPHRICLFSSLKKKSNSLGPLYVIGFLSPLESTFIDRFWYSFN